MLQTVVPFRGEAAKQRLEASREERASLALAMLGDVLAAATAVGRTLLSTADPEAGARGRGGGAGAVAAPGGGQGAAVAAVLAQAPAGVTLVVNADVPCVVPRDLRTLAGPAGLGALGLVEARDGTTNALALPDPALFAPLYGGGSAARFRDHADAHGVTAVALAIPNLADDVDTLEDLERVALRAGPRTQAALGQLVRP
jgi:2-phospho-L-lactate guanylyltransferase